MIYYRWISSGECDACAAMDGLYADLPVRPHPFCRCTIVAIQPVFGTQGCYGTEPILVEWDDHDVRGEFDLDDDLAPGEPPIGFDPDDPGTWPPNTLGAWGPDEIERDENGMVVTVVMDLRATVLCPDNSILDVSLRWEDEYFDIDEALLAQANRAFPNDANAAQALFATLSADDTYWSSVADKFAAEVLDVARDQCPYCDDGSEPDELDEGDDEVELGEVER